MKTSFSLSNNIFFSPELRTSLGRIILFIAIGSFLLHLTLYTFYTYLLGMEPAGLLSSPINAIYTPFSFLLIYEAYLLLYYLQHSTTIYVGKQYEIIVLILIRGIFKDMTHLDLNQNNFLSANNIEFWYDLGAVIILFILILLFYRISGKKSMGVDGSEGLANANVQLQKFIISKRILATILFLGSHFLLNVEVIIGVIVTTALISVIIIASLIGTFIPLLLNKFNIDPALATGPFITTSNDICGILIYFSIAKLILGF